MQTPPNRPNLRLVTPEPQTQNGFTSGLLRLIATRDIRVPPPPPLEEQPADLVFRIHAHAARIGRTGPTPLICRGART